MKTLSRALVSCTPGGKRAAWSVTEASRNRAMWTTTHIPQSLQVLPASDSGFLLAERLRGSTQDGRGS